MTLGEIFETAYTLKAFQMWELQKELEKNWGFLGKSYIKERVKSWLTIQLKYNAVIKVNNKPPIFTFPEFLNIWQECIRKRVCPICEKQFIPTQDKQQFCSEECKKKHYKTYHEERRKKEGMKTGSKKRWSKAEELLLLKLKNQGLSNSEIAKQLNRSTTSVVEKYKQLTGVRK